MSALTASTLSVARVARVAWGARLARLRAWGARHPETWLYAVAVAAGSVLLVAHGGFAPGGHAAHAAHAAAAVPLGVAAWHWTLMVLAMMLPMAAPQARVVALRSVWVRRHRAAVVFVVGYVAVWLAVGLPVTLAASTVSLPTWTGPALLGAAAVWHVSGRRRRALRRCGSVRLRAPSGAAADTNCLAVGVRAGGLCVVACGPAMLPMALQPAAAWGLPVMVGVLVVMLVERAPGPDPAHRMGRPGPALALLALAAYALLGGALP